MTAAAGGGAGGGGRWGGESRTMVNGPCMNPDCEHPHDSPQWRKGPPQCPILCNACGTRWLRNGTLKPLVVSGRPALPWAALPCGRPALVVRPCQADLVDLVEP